MSKLESEATANGADPTQVKANAMAFEKLDEAKRLAAQLKKTGK